MFPKYDVSIIGPAIIDVLAAPVGEEVFQYGSMPMKEIKLSFGGNALNEAVVLSKLERKVDLISKIGEDRSGEFIKQFIRDNGIEVDHIVTEKNLSTGINVVLVDKHAERRFLTNPHGSLRKLSEEDITPFMESLADIVSFSCMFISPLLDIDTMERIFSAIKKKSSRTLVVDLTKPKHQETLEDIRKLLPYIDYFVPNREELCLLSGDQDVTASAMKLIQYGVKFVIVKEGKNGCTSYSQDGICHVAAYQTEAIDTTGAGDSFAAGLIYSLQEDMTHEERLQFATATASCCVEKLGATDGFSSKEKVFQRFEKIRRR